MPCVSLLYLQKIILAPPQPLANLSDATGRPHKRIDQARPATPVARLILVRYRF